MSEGPWIRFFSSDWLAGTRGMTAAETGVYITLVAMMYERGGPIHNEPARLARLCGTSNSGFKKALETLAGEGKIAIDADGYLSNIRVLEELSYTREKQAVAREAANTRWHGKANKNNDRDDASALRPHCDGNANQNQNQNQNRTSSDEDVARTPRNELETVLDSERAKAVIEHRQRKRAPLTAHAAKLLAKQFARWPDPNAAADEMIEAGWNGFKPEWMEGRTMARGHGPPKGETAWERQRRAFEEISDELNQQRSDEGLTGVVLSLPQPGTQRQ